MDFPRKLSFPYCKPSAVMVYYSASRANKPVNNNKDKDRQMEKTSKAPTVKPMTRKGWVVRITDAKGAVYFPIFKDMGHVDVERHDDMYDDVIPFTTVFGTKEIAKSRIPDVRKAALSRVRSTFLVRPTLPIKVEAVRFFRQIG